MKVIINFPVEMGFDEINVRLTADCEIINTGIGGYEYMGSREFDEGENIIQIKNIRWDQFLYTLRENNTIRVATETNKCYNAFVTEIKQIIEDSFS